MTIDTKDKQLIVVGALAVELVAAEQLAKFLHGEYVEALKYYGENVERIEGRFSPTNPAHAGAIKFSAPFYAKYTDAKRIVRNVRKRMETAARKAMR